MKLNQHLEFGPALLDVGYQAESRGVIASDQFPQHLRNLTSVFAKFGIRPFSALAINLLWRTDNYLDQTASSSGADLSVNVSNALIVFGGISGSHRFPTFQEIHLLDTLFALHNSGAETESSISRRRHTSDISKRFCKSGVAFTRKGPDMIYSPFHRMMRVQ